MATVINEPPVRTPRGLFAAPARREAPRTATERVHECPLCQSTRWSHWRWGQDRLHRVSDQIFTYARCLDCDLIFQNHRPRAEEVAAFYPSDYGPYKPSSGGKQRARKSLPRRVAAALNQACGHAHEAVDGVCSGRLRRLQQQFYVPRPRGSVLLDFGCGSDKFLNKARAQGWRTIGADFSLATVERVRLAGHGAHLADDSLWHAIPDGSLDCIRLNHVLEHLYQPRETLARLHTKLKPKTGRMHLAVPNPSSWASWLFRSCWLGLDCPRHIMLFTPRRLRDLLQELGYRDVQIEHEAAAKDVARSIGYGLADKGWLRPQRAGELLHHHALQCALYVPARVAAALRGGDRLHAFASA